MTTRKAPFIVFEGGEGCGKSSQSKRLAEALRGHGIDVEHTRDPGGCPSAAEIRSLLVTGAADRWSKKTDMLLYTAARVELIEHVIQPALDAGRPVISDRFIGSTIAYQGNGDHARTKTALDLHSQFCGDLFPDLTILLDADPEIGLSRSKRRLAAEASAESRFEDMELSFHRRLRQVFTENARDGRLSKDWLVIDATRPEAEIAAAILDRVLPIFGIRAAKAA